MLFQIHICFHLNILTNTKHNILIHLLTTQTTLWIRSVRLIAANCDCKGFVLCVCICVCVGLLRCILVLRCYSRSHFTWKEKEDKQHHHLFSISICTLHTRSLARVKICVILWCSAISLKNLIMSVKSMLFSRMMSL